MVVSNLWGGWEYGVLCNNGFTFVKEPGFIFFFPPWAAGPNTETPEVCSKERVHPQGNQAGRPENALESASLWARAGCSRMKTEQQVAWGVGSLRKAMDKVRDRGPRGGPKLRLCAAARAGGGASRDPRPRPVGGSAVHPVLTAQLQLDAAESGFLESNPGGYFMVLAS